MNKTYLVAMKVGGLPERPVLEYEDLEFIQAESVEEAKEKYRKLTNQTYFPACVLSEWVGEEQPIIEENNFLEWYTQLLHEGKLVPVNNQ